MSKKHFICVLVIVFIVFDVTSVRIFQNNVCKGYVDYLFKDISKNCFYSPELFAQTDDLIRRHVGSIETYNVTTDDGYILTIFRIPITNPKGVVILQHPVTTDSVVWVGQSNESFAFLLWRTGYDVWLPNHRGTYFSRKHVSLSVEDEKYWDFSFHEIGLYDYKTIIDFVKKKTHNKEIIFVAHSMSTTSSLIYSSLRPEEAASSVKIFISMSPVCYLKHVKSPVKYLAYITPFLRQINKILKITHLQEYESKSMRFLRFFMLSFPFKFILSLMISFFQGWNPEEFDPLLMNLSISQHPRSYPWKLFYHYVQQFKAGGRFQMYDYGCKINEKLYGTAIPPEYPVHRIITPTYLIYSDEDSLATAQDAELLFNHLNPQAKIYGKLRVSGINHVDFHYGKHRKQKILNKIMELLEKIR